jgi:hypothetical protein
MWTWILPDHRQLNHHIYHPVRTPELVKLLHMQIAPFKLQSEIALSTTEAEFILLS